VYPLHAQAREQLRGGAPAPTTPSPADWAEQEFGGALLGDERLKRRLLVLARDFYARPQASMPEACQSRSKTKAAYRFFDHPETQMDVLLEPHNKATQQRAAAALSSDNWLPPTASKPPWRLIWWWLGAFSTWPSWAEKSPMCPAWSTSRMRNGKRWSPTSPGTLCLPPSHPRCEKQCGWSLHSAFLGRKADGEPGTKTLWFGLQYLDAMTAMWKILASASLTPCVQLKIWVKISPLGRGGCQKRNASLPCLPSARGPPSRVHSPLQMTGSRPA